MRFVMAYSGGKDCTLALDRMLRAGHTCVALMVVVGIKGQYSYMHIFTRDVLEKFSESLGVPLILVPSKNKHDAAATLNALRQAKELYGAEAVCSGDIDYEDARRWNESVAKEAGLQSFFPLWMEDRYKLLDELFERGFTCLFKVIDTSLLPEELLGKPLTRECIPLFEKSGVDVCGEKGEYHTITVDGPIFKKKIEFRYDRVYHNGKYCSLICNVL